MAVTSFATASQTTPEGMTLVGVLGNSTSASNAGNSRYVNANLKQNTQYVFRYFPSSTASTTSWPDLYWYKDSTGTFGTIVGSFTSAANNTYEDRIVYNTQSGVTKIVFNSVTLPSGFIAIYETATISAPANFYSADVFADSLTTTANIGYNYGDNTTIGNNTYYYLQSGGNSYIARSSSTGDGLNYSLIGGGASAFWLPSSSSNPSKIFMNQSGSTREVRYSTNNGVDWTTGTSLPTTSYSYNQWSPIVYNAAAGRYLSVRNHALDVGWAHSTDGDTWTYNTGTFVYNGGQPNHIFVSNGYFVVVFDTGPQYEQKVYYSADGLTWTQTTITQYTGGGGSYQNWTGMNRNIIQNGTYFGLQGVSNGSFKWLTVTSGPSMNLGYTYNAVTNSSSPFIVPTKNFWVACHQSNGNAYWTAPRTGTETDMYWTWTQRAHGGSGSYWWSVLPDSRPPSSADASFYATIGNNSTTNNRKISVTPKGLTTLG